MLHKNNVWCLIALVLKEKLFSLNNGLLLSETGKIGTLNNI